MPNHRLTLTTGVAVAVLIAAGVLVAGPINPPAGPVAETNTLRLEADARLPVNAETAPGDAAAVFRITSQGSYYLTGDVSGVSAGQSGVVIEASNVTLDLNGYTLTGVDNSGDGIRIAEGVVGVVVRNGFVREWWGDGLSVGANSGAVLVEGMSAISNRGNGFVSASVATFRNCRAVVNLDSGFRLINDGLVEDSEARGNSQDGFVGWGTYRSCQAFDHPGRGFSVPFGLVERCRAAANNTGFELGTILSPTIPSRVHVIDSVSERSANTCFLTRGEATLEGCSSHNSLSNGFQLFDDGARLIDCVAIRPAFNGITVNGVSVIDGSSVHYPGNNGIWVLTSSEGASISAARVVGAGAAAYRLDGRAVTLRDSVAASPATSGILVGQTATIERCTVSLPGQSGVLIQPTSEGAVITDSVVMEPAIRGFDLQGQYMTVKGCRAIRGVVGFQLPEGAGGTIQNCEASGFSAVGFDILGSSVFTGNVARGAVDGFVVVSNGLVGPTFVAGQALDNASPHANFEIFDP